MIVIDSVAALVPRAEVEGDMGDSYMGLQARMMSQGLRKLTSVLAPNQNENLNYVWESRDDHRRKRTQVLCLSENRNQKRGKNHGGQRANRIFRQN